MCRGTGAGVGHAAPRGGGTTGLVGPHVGPIEPCVGGTHVVHVGRGCVQKGALYL